MTESEGGGRGSPPIHPEWEGIRREPTGILDNLSAFPRRVISPLSWRVLVALLALAVLAGLLATCPEEAGAAGSSAFPRPVAEEEATADAANPVELPAPPGAPEIGGAEKPVRAQAESPPPPGGPMRLLVEVVDPLELLARDHQLVASGAGDVVCRRWRRDGALLIGEWSDETAPPQVLEYFIETLRPAEVLAATASFAEDPEGGWRARLDLTEAVALVDLVVVGEPLRVLPCSLKALFRHGRVEGVLDLLERVREEPLTVVAPVPCMITTELNDRNGSPQYAQRTLLRIQRGGRQRYEILAASGSVRVRVHEPPGRSSGPSESLVVEMWPELQHGGQQCRRMSEISPGADLEFTLVPPGRYELFCRASGEMRTIAGRLLEVGVGETLVELRAPQDDRTLRVLGAPPNTEVWLLRPGVCFDASRGALAGADGVALLEGLDAAEWLVWARGADGVAVARADTRTVRDGEVVLETVAQTIKVEIEFSDWLPGGAEIVLTESTGRVLRPGPRLSPQGVSGPLVCEAWVLPGLLRIRALHANGRVVDEEVLVPEAAPASGRLLVPLKFRDP